MERQIVWEQHLATGIDELDNQHKVLCELVSDLDIAARKGVEPERIGTLFSVIENYAFFHFETEEKLIRDDIEYLEHCHEHYKLIRQLFRYSAEYRNGKTSLLELADFLYNWLMHHIVESDLPAFKRTPVDSRKQRKVDLIDDFTDEPIDKRVDPRIDHAQLSEDDIVGHCFNANKSISGIATILNISEGGLKLTSATRHKIGDLLMLNCKIGDDFKLEEKVRVRNTDDKGYIGAEFVSPKQKTLDFLKQVKREL